VYKPASVTQHNAKEQGFVRFRRFVESADLSNKLECGSPNLLLGDWWIEVEEGFYIPAHAFKRRLPTSEHRDRSQWTVEPFAGTVKDGIVYGRGAEAIKSLLAAELAVLVDLKRKNYWRILKSDISSDGRMPLNAPEQVRDVLAATLPTVHNVDLFIDGERRVLRFCCSARPRNQPRTNAAIPIVSKLWHSRLSSNNTLNYGYAAFLRAPTHQCARADDG